MNSGAPDKIERCRRAAASLNGRQHDRTTQGWRAILSNNCAQPPWMSPSSCLEGLSCSRAPAIPRTAPELCIGFSPLARRENRARQCCDAARSEEHLYELHSLMRISYAVLFVKKQKRTYCQDVAAQKSQCISNLDGET